MRSNCPDCGAFGKTVSVTVNLDGNRVEELRCPEGCGTWVDGEALDDRIRPHS